MLKLLISLILSILSIQQSRASISFGNVQIAEERIDLFTSDFETVVNVPGVKVTAKLIKNTIEWVRDEDVLLIPRGRIAIRIEDGAKDLHIRYEKKSLIMQSISQKAHIEFYVSLYQSKPIEVFDGNKKLGEIKVKAKRVASDREAHLIDYSCAQYFVEIKGLENDFLSLGCRSSNIGEFGKQKKMVEIIWMSANHQLLDNSTGPYISVFFESHPIKTKVINPHTGQIKYVEISAKIPSRYHRLKTALGLGPYEFTSSNSESEKSSDKVAPSFMFYGKLDFDQSNSLRFFDALVWQKSYFNNFGLYYAYDLALILDRRLLFTALIGVQHVSYRFDPGTPTISELMLPQGLEMVYKHPFGLKNYSMAIGGFIDPGNANFYKNVWLRFGKKIFYEINYISWENKDNDEQEASMWGLSVGFPFLSFF